MITYVKENGELIKGSDSRKLKSRIALTIKTYEQLGSIPLSIGGFIFIFMLWMLSFFVFRIASHLAMHYA